MGAEPTISSRAVQKLLALSPDFERAADELCAEAGIDATARTDPDGRIPIVRLHALWDAVLRRLPGEDAALQCATNYSPGDYGLVGFVCMNSTSLGEGLLQMVRFVRLWSDEPAMKLADDGCLSLTYRARFADGPGMRIATEAAFAEVLNAARLLTQQLLAPREVRFRHPPPKDLAAHRAFFGAPVHFSAGADELLLTREQLALPLPKADPQLGEYLHHLANDALARRGEDSGSVQARVRALLAEELPKGVPGLETLARRMSLSERTLRRRLEEGGTSFRQMLDATRSELAQGYIRDRRIPLSEVAFLLGFSEPSTFHRAFRRWTQMTPAAWRQQHGEGTRGPRPAQ